MVRPQLFLSCAPALFICAGLQAATIDLSSYPLLASFHSDGQYDLSGANTWNGQPVSPTNMPRFQQRELSERFNFFGDSMALNVMYVQVTDVSTTNGASWFGTAFDNVTLTGIRESNTDPVTVLGFSNAFANPGQILASGGPRSEVSSPLQTTPGYTLTQGSNQFWISTVNGADYGFTSLVNITGAN